MLIKDLPSPKTAINRENKDKAIMESKQFKTAIYEKALNSSHFFGWKC